MKRVLSVFCFLFLFIIFSFAQPRVLFIGNSYTSVNNLPELIYNCAKSTGDKMDYVASTPGGCTFQTHLTTSASYIEEGNWDFVVLQEQSQLPSFPYSQFMQQSYPYAQELCQMIRDVSPNAQIVFYMTWGRKYGDQQNAAYYPVLGTYEGMDSLLYARYMMMAEDNEAVISPVGALWHHIRDNYPQIELYQSDESHPSMAGSYAAACSFFSIFYKKNPTQITFVPSSLDPSEADIIRYAAETVVYDSLNKWLFISSEDTTSNGDTTSVISYDNVNVEVYPNPAQNTLSLNISKPTISDITIHLYSMSGQLLLSERIQSNLTKPIDISTIPSGSYVLKVSDANRCLYSKPIIISK